MPSVVPDRAVCAAIHHPHEMLAESIPHLTWVSGPHGEVLYANRRARDYFGQSLD